ncbi:MAG TPA: class I SAM-dependent methyltransferase [bacterium]
MDENRLPLPPQALRFMNESDERFLKTREEFLRILRQCGFGANSSVLDIGCGYGRLAYGIIANMDFRGQYLGVDILPKHVQWCSDAITPEHGNFQFEVLNIHNACYNPRGLFDARTYRFKISDATFDYGALFSVFTHMYEPEIRNYLGEIKRILKPGGTCVSTYFLFDEARLPAITDAQHSMSMEFTLNEHTRYHNAEDPLHAIAYERNHAIDQITGFGFDLLECTYGSWAGDGGESYQDLVVFRK